MITVCAQVRRITSFANHAVLTADGKRALPAATIVRIVADGDGFLLLRFTDSGIGVTDTWHMTVDEAKHQAALEYEIHEDDWRGGAD